MRRIIQSLPVTLAFLSASLDAAADCTIKPPPENLYLNGDAHYQKRLACNQVRVSDFIAGFHMDEVDWNQGMGWSAPCDPNAPLGRTLHGLMALQFSHPDPIMNGTNYGDDVLRWAGIYSRNNFDELDSGCAFHSSASALTYNKPPQDEKTILYMDFFYNFAPSERAAVLLHEARHASGVDHAPDSCPRRASCDTAFNGAGGAVKGANTYQVWYAGRYVERGTGANWINKDRARDHANNTLDTAFNNPTTARVEVSKDTPLMSDLNGDGYSDLVIFRESDGSWHALDGLSIRSGQRVELINPPVKYGARTDQPFIGDIDRDGSKDLIIYRTAFSTDPYAHTKAKWYAYSLAKKKPLFENIELGDAFEPAWKAAIPLVGDIDGDGGSDIVVYYPHVGRWYSFKGTSLTVPAAPTVLLWDVWFGGLAGDTPLLGSFNADNREDLVIFQPSTGMWHVLDTLTNALIATRIPFGENGDVPMVADIDGRGKADDFVIYRPRNGEWHSRGVDVAWHFGPKQFGGLADRPLLGHFRTGSPRLDPVLYRSTEGTWHAVDRVTNILLLCADGITTCQQPNVPYGSPY
jgi:hypothetical protein